MLSLSLRRPGLCMAHASACLCAHLLIQVSHCLRQQVVPEVCPSPCLSALTSESAEHACSSMSQPQNHNWGQAEFETLAVIHHAQHLRPLAVSSSRCKQAWENAQSSLSSHRGLLGSKGGGGEGVACAAAQLALLRAPCQDGIDVLHVRTAVRTFQDSQGPNHVKLDSE